MAITTQSNLPAPVALAFSYKLLSVPTPNFIHGEAAEAKEMDVNSGTDARFRRYNPLSSAPIPLGDTGVTPPSQTLSALNIDAKIQWYGSWVQLHEQVVLQNQDPVLNEGAVRLGVSLRQTQDQLIRDMLATSATFVNCVGGGGGDNPTPVSGTDLDDVTTMLLSNNGHMITNNIPGEDRFGTSPVRQAYIAMCHTNLNSDFNNIPGWIDKYSYPNNNAVLDSEIGQYRNTRVLVSSEGSVEPNSSGILGRDVYNIFIAAKEAYGVVYQSGATAEFIYLDPRFSGPLALYGSIAFKFAECPVLFNDLWLYRLRATKSI